MASQREELLRKIHPPQEVLEGGGSERRIIRLEGLESYPGWFTSVGEFLSDVRAEYR